MDSGHHCPSSPDYGKIDEVPSLTLIIVQKSGEWSVYLTFWFSSGSRNFRNLFGVTCEVFVLHRYFWVHWVVKLCTTIAYPWLLRDSHSSFAKFVIGCNSVSELGRVEYATLWIYSASCSRGLCAFAYLAVWICGKMRNQIRSPWVFWLAEDLLEVALEDLCCHCQKIRMLIPPSSLWTHQPFWQVLRSISRCTSRLLFLWYWLLDSSSRFIY